MNSFESQMEACLYSRPLHFLSDSPKDFRSIITGHALIGSALNAISEPTLYCGYSATSKRILYSKYYF